MKSRTRSKAGFTLVEVTLALGIAVYACLIVVGLFTSGLYNFDLAQNKSATARISQTLMNEVAQSDWASLFSLLPVKNTPGTVQTFPTRFFDVQGDEIVGGNARKQAIFLAKPVLIVPSANPGVNYSSTTTGEPEFLQVVVEIMNLPGGNDPTSDANTSLWVPTSAQATRLTKFSFIVARTSHS